MLLSDQFPESRENVVRLPEGDARSFAVFAEYVYVGDECDTGATMGDTDNEETNMPNSSVPGTGEGEKDNYDTDVEVSDEDNVVHDHYSFPFQFSRYVLGDKLQASGFKCRIMEEIRCHGEFCNPSDLTIGHIQYVYDNTISQDGPLRRFCIRIKCKRISIGETLADSEFLNLMEVLGERHDTHVQEAGAQAEGKNRGASAANEKHKQAMIR